MATTGHFEGIFNSGRIKGYKAGDVFVRDFFREKALSTRLSRTPLSIIESTPASRYAVIYPKPGKMLMYHYDAKLKEVLPYWDRFPVNFPIELYDDGFLAINLHYLPPVFRIRLMDALYDTITDTRYDQSTKLAINYKILNASSKLKYFKPCLKRYLYSHIKSKIIEIPIEEWDYCAFLPTARFVKASQRKVWEQSVKDISNG